MNESHKNIVVLGAGESGVGAALLGKAKGYNVFVSDGGAIKSVFKEEMLANDIPFEEKQHTIEKLMQADVLIKSPGIPNASSIIQKCIAAGKKPIGEIEFAAQFSRATFIAITGSNGKTTTTNLIYHVLKKAELDVEMGGNVGTSLARQLLVADRDYFVLELSSFQLEDIQHFRPHIAIILNIVADHLDRYEYKIENYANAKMRITNNQLPSDFLIYNADDPITSKIVAESNITVTKIPFSLNHSLPVGGYLANEKLIIKYKNQLVMSIHDLALKGRHNVQNSLAAGIAGRIVEIRKENIRESLADFQSVEHRLEFVAKVNGISFINDSKATNVNATWYALESMQEPTVWVVGGVDKGNDYDELKALVKDKVKAIVCLGLENQKIIDAFQGVVSEIVETRSAEQAVAEGYRLAKKGETVLLSPACASFDLFENYEDRGRSFKRAVRAL
ncbi:MAG: UDP-N-acetylmuramoyl-L-alanine--D-glutamate ligase [Crocinitomicaceae bacterium]|nr:UDP-N-acetylmuramoyl-L-alanine--D-glutamate ligase [Crocinitomicaceae bacterium]